MLKLNQRIQMIMLIKFIRWVYISHLDKIFIMQILKMHMILINVTLMCWVHTDDSYGWSQYTPTDEIQPFDGVITTGSYYIETDKTLTFPLRGNGVYCDAVVNELLSDNSIKLDDIKYQIKPLKSKPPDFFQDFVHSVANVFHGYNLANNGFIKSWQYN